jgi:hypothetical protein
MGDGEGGRTHESGEGGLIAFPTPYRGFKGTIWRSANLIKKVLALVCERDVYSLRSFNCFVFYFLLLSRERTLL